MFIGLTIIISTLVPIWAQLMAPATECTVSAAVMCLKPLLDLLSSNSPNPSELESKMNRICLQEQDITECMDSASSFCPHNMRSAFRISFIGYLDFMTELCSEESSFQNQYLDHVGCFLNFSSELLMCKNDLEQFISSIKDKNDFLTYKKQICCRLDEFRTCLRKKTGQRCEEGGVEMIEKMFAIFLKSVYLIGCSDFEQDSPSCFYEEKPSSAFQFASNPYLLLFAIFIAIGQFY